MGYLQEIASKFQYGLRKKTHKVKDISKVYVTMSDGIKLSTVIYLPDSDPSFPVIMIRNPYNQLVDYLNMIATLFSQYGYAVVIQQCRGTGASEGEWIPFVNERQDGLDTLEWIISQAWCNDNIGTYGHSYLTETQWAIADSLPTEVKTMVLSGFTTERYRQNYMNGMFRHDVYTGWAIENSGIVTEKSNSELFKKAIQHKPHIEMDIALFGQKLPWYREWIINVSKLDSYWDEGFWKKLKGVPEHVNIPVLMIDGWYDQHLDGMVKDFYKLNAKIRKRSKFIIGPWGHTLETVGDLEHHGSYRNLFKDALEWFDMHLRQDFKEKSSEEFIIYVIGEGIWLQQSDYMANVSCLEFYLSYNKSLTCKQSDVNFGKLDYLYDPKNAISSHGGAALLRYISGANDATPAGSMKQPPPDYRIDVCSFVSNILEKEINIKGVIKVQLYVSTDVEDTAFFVSVMDMTPDGESYNIREGISSIVYRNDSDIAIPYTPNEVVEMTIELWPIAWTVKKGHRLRVDIQSSNSPAYHIHSNQTGPWALQTDSIIAKQSIHISQTYINKLIIPQLLNIKKSI